MGAPLSFVRRVMIIRMPLMTIAAIAAASAAVAEPPKADQRPASSPAPTATPVILASAQDVRQPGPSQGERPADRPRRVAPRVTTCRCGDPQPTAEQPDQ